MTKNIICVESGDKVSEIYLTGRIENNVLNYAAEIDGGKVRGRVPATSDIEAEIQAAYKVIESAVNRGCKEINLHSDLKSPILYLNGTKAMGEVSKTFVRNVKKLTEQHGLTIKGYTDAPKDKTEKLYKAAFPKNQSKEEKPKLENPFSAPKREVPKNTMRGWSNLGNAVRKPQWSVKVIKDDKCVIDISDKDFRGCDETTIKRDAAYLADWWEQVEKAEVVRQNIPARVNDFSNYKGFNGKAIDVDKGLETIWKDGEVIYDGKVMKADKESYAEQHPDSEWAKELAEEAALKNAEDELFAEYEENKSEQLSMF